MPARVSAVRFRPGIALGAILEPVDDAQALAIVLEAAVRLHQVVQHAFAGVAERRMADVVREHDRLDQILVRAERARDGARDLRDLERVREPIPEVVALVVREDLRLVLQAAERARVQHAVAVALEHGAIAVLGLGLDPTARVARAHGVGRERFRLARLDLGPCAQARYGALVFSSTSRSSFARSSSLCCSEAAARSGGAADTGGGSAIAPATRSAALSPSARAAR